MEALRKGPRAVCFVLIPFALILWAFVSLVSLKSHRYSQAEVQGEHVLTREIGGHAYALYFHRARPHFNSVEKDGVRIFDSREVEASEGCVWELLDREARPVVRCFRAATEPSLIERPLI